jgi:hypothetical protein
MEAQTNKVTPMTKKKIPGGGKDISEFHVNPELSMTKRIAQFLDWAAVHRPRAYMAFNIIWQAVTGEKKLTHLNSDGATFVKKAISRVRQELLKTYKRGMDSQRGLGVRATVDDVDMVKFDVSAKAHRVESAQKSFIASVNVVDPANIPNTVEMKPFLGYIKDAKKIALLMQTPDYIKALLPPKKEEAEG